MSRLLRPLGKLIKDYSLEQVIKSSRCLGTATYQQTLLNIPPTRVTVLDNGMRVATEDSGSETATVGLWINSGSRFETDSNNGVGYFLEHMMFKGTKKRPQTDLELEVENLGMRLDVSTSREHTGISAMCVSQDVGKAVEILSDILQNSKLDEGQIEKERSVILREMEEAESNYQQVACDFTHAAAFQGTPLARPVIGTTDTIKSITKQDLVDYASANFTAPRIVLAGAGGIDHDTLVQLAEDLFKRLPVGEPPVVDTCRFTGSEIRYRDDAVPFCHTVVAVEGVGWANPDKILLTLASLIIGSWDRTHGGGEHCPNIIAQAAVKENMCHAFQSFNVSYRDTGLWGIYFVNDPSTVHNFCIDYLFDEWLRLCTSVTQFEVERAKNTLRTSLLRQLDGTAPLCEDIGKQILNRGRRAPFHELDARIEAISADEVRDVCYRKIYDHCIAVGTVGRNGNLPDYNVLRSKMYWLRL